MNYTGFTTLVGTSDEEGYFCICAVTRGLSDTQYIANAKVPNPTLDRVENPEQLKAELIAKVAAESLHKAALKELVL